MILGFSIYFNNFCTPSSDMGRLDLKMFDLIMRSAVDASHFQLLVAWYGLFGKKLIRCHFSERTSEGGRCKRILFIFLFLKFYIVLLSIPDNSCVFGLWTNSIRTFKCEHTRKRYTGFLDCSTYFLNSCGNISYYILLQPFAGRKWSKWRVEER